MPARRNGPVSSNVRRHRNHAPSTANDARTISGQRIKSEKPMQNNSVFEIAGAAFELLEDIHSDFMLRVVNLALKTSAGCSVAVENNELVAMCFGCKLIALHRPVVINDAFAMIEYPFSIHERDKPDKLIYAIYIYPNGDIYSDTTKTNQIAGTGNLYLAQRLLPNIGIALLGSRHFEPRK